MVSFTDLFGCQRAKIVPAQAISEMEKMVPALRALRLGWICRPLIPICWLFPIDSAVVNFLEPDVAWVRRIAIWMDQLSNKRHVTF